LLLRAAELEEEGDDYTSRTPKMLSSDDEDNTEK
jgi:hypothetical protein